VIAALLAAPADPGGSNSPLAFVAVIVFCAVVVGYLMLKRGRA
jgi:hypothetical protein